MSFRELTALVTKDAILCTRILNTVNSAAYGRSRTITSIQQAVTLMGIGQLRRIAVGFVVGNLLPAAKTPRTWSRQRFNMHAGATALLTEAIVDKIAPDEKGGAFVGGMLHDLGKLLIAVTLPQEYDMIAAAALATQAPVFECEMETLGIDHTELSALALLKWGLPEFVWMSVRRHHEWHLPDAPRLATVIAKADGFVNHLAITVLPPAVHEGEPPSIEIPGYDFDTAEVLQRFETEWIPLARFFE
jgi:HD-like signal output (HDOD) protein